MDALSTAGSRKQGADTCSWAEHHRSDINMNKKIVLCMMAHKVV
jgi:hypothetical protein